MPNLMRGQIMGHVGRDAELKTIPSGAHVLEFSVAAKQRNPNDEDETVWWRCTIWGKRGEKLAPMIVKGSPVFCAGEMRFRQYQKKDGSVGQSNEMRCDAFEFAGRAPQTNDDFKTQGSTQPNDEIPF